MEKKPTWIWRNNNVPHDTVRFQRNFHCGNEMVKITLSADSDLIAFLDGTEIIRGQFSDYPDAKTSSSVSVALSSGEHSLEVLVYYCGVDSQIYIKGDPGLWGQIETADGTIVTDEEWLCCTKKTFLRDRLDHVTSQHGIVTTYDARQEDLPPVWEKAVQAVSRPAPTARPVPLLEKGNPVYARLVNQGFFRRKNENTSYAKLCYSDSLFLQPPHKVLDGCTSVSYAAAPPEAPWKLQTLPAGYDGYFLTLDLGQELVGLENFELDFPAGTIVDIAYGEHLTDCRVRCSIADRNFADRYIAGSGKREITMPRRIGGRYLELHITPAQPGEYTIFKAGLVPLRAALPEASDFSCDDVQLMTMCRNSVRTLELCLHEHYEDCPWREQALYAYDSRNQILYGSYLWDQHHFIEAAINLLGKGLRKDGVLALCAPSRIAPPICIFSFSWIVEICEYIRHSGNFDFFLKMQKTCKIILDTALQRFQPERGLYCTPDNKELWNFYEWRPGLEGSGCIPGTPDALYNLYLLEALDLYSEIANNAELRSKADTLRQAIFKEYYDAERGCMKTFDHRDDTHEITQVLALYTACIPESEHAKIIRGIIAGAHVPISSSSIRYYYAALLDKGQEVREFLHKKLWQTFGKMTQGDSTTMWETENGGEDFQQAGSLCHGWSALPIWYFFAAKLGLHPLEPGWKRFLIAPVEFSGEEAYGEVPLKSGNLKVRIRRTEAGLELEATGPDHLTPEFRPYAPEEYVSARWNGKNLL